MTVRSLHFLRGPNLFAYMPVIHAVMDIGQYEEGRLDVTCGAPAHCDVGRRSGVAQVPLNHPRSRRRRWIQRNCASLLSEIIHFPRTHQLRGSYVQVSCQYYVVLG